MMIIDNSLAYADKLKQKILICSLMLVFFSNGFGLCSEFVIYNLFRRSQIIDTKVNKMKRNYF